jgi:hypothetical protein
MLAIFIQFAALAILLMFVDGDKRIKALILGIDILIVIAWYFHWVNFDFN